ncbi:MAG: rhodanese-like domain-containing protein [Myxococcota bacterium]|nr:rhodanese-like domain-containing protein [Myxococcota bacterium]
MMIRDRLKKVARKAAIKVLKMDFDTQERDPAARRRGNPDDFDPSKIPTVVDGSGDTPGPNHKHDIGRTWTAAQLAGAAAPFFLDIRPPQETVAGLLPGAVVLPGELVREHLGVLPPKTERVTVYDQTGDLGSAEVAAWLREQGWEWARRLQGGYAEWIEHDETIVSPDIPDGARLKLGDPVRLEAGGEGWVLSVDTSGAEAAYTVWHADGTTTGPLTDEALEA